MQETVSGYKFRIFHHCPGGRVWGGQAVVELAAWGFGHPSPVNGSWKTGAHFHAKGWGLLQGALALVLRWHEDNPAQRPEQGTPRPLVASGPGTQQRQRRFRMEAPRSIPGRLADNTFALHYDFSNT